MSTSRGTGAPRRWAVPIALVTLAGLAIAIVLGTPLQALLVLGLWLICPLMMMTMHAGHEHHPPGAPFADRDHTMGSESGTRRWHGEGDGPPRR